MFDETCRMQKRANSKGWRFVVVKLFSAALILQISVPGLHLSVGMTDLSRLVLGDEPTTGLQGAEDCVQQCAV
jgi:hypothetical protein